MRFPLFPARSVRSLAIGFALVSSIAAIPTRDSTAQDEGPAAVAMASAISYAPIPANSALDIVPATDTELASNALSHTIAALAARGHADSPEAPYVVNVDAVLIRGVGQDAGLARQEEGTRRGDQYTNADKSPAGDPLTRGNLFSSTDGALFSPAQPHTGGHLLRVSYEVYSRQSGLYVWRGQIERDSLGVGPDASLEQMISALLAHFGDTLAESEVPLN